MSNSLEANKPPGAYLGAYSRHYGIDLMYVIIVARKIDLGRERHYAITCATRQHTLFFAASMQFSIWCQKHGNAPFSLLHQRELAYGASC